MTKMLLPDKERKEMASKNCKKGQHLFYTDDGFTPKDSIGKCMFRGFDKLRQSNVKIRLRKLYKP